MMRQRYWLGALVLLACGMTGCTHLPHSSLRSATPTAIATPPHQVTQDGCSPLPVALDDRSTASGFVRSYYNAITRHDYPRAYGYLQPLNPPNPTTTDFIAWKAGYATTACVFITYIGPETAAPSTTPGLNAAKVGTLVPIALTAVQIDGTIQQYTGIYDITSNPAIGLPTSGALDITLSTLTPMP